MTTKTLSDDSPCQNRIPSRGTWCQVTHLSVSANMSGFSSPNISKANEPGELEPAADRLVLAWWNR